MRPSIAAAALTALMLALGLAHNGAAQDFESPPPSVPPTPPAPTRFVMPDIQDSWMDWSRYDGDHFSTRLSLVPIIDYNTFHQDDDSVSQVGRQKNQWDLRTFRIMFRGQIKSRVPIEYFASFEVKGNDHLTGPDDHTLAWTDLYIAIGLGRVGKLTFGKIKEPWVYEMVGDAANLQQEERALNPFFQSRNIGLRLSNTMAGDRMTWAAGWFNDWWPQDQPFDDSGNQFSARVTGVPLLSADGARFLHLGVSVRYTGGDNDTLRFRGRPESNVSSYFVDTGSLPANHANEFGLESLWGNGPFLLAGEYVRARLDSPSKANPSFWGGYVTASYVLTGEHRPYDLKVGYARRVMPRERWGAWEVVGRYSYVDLDDRLVSGGTMGRATLGLNWWATRHWRIGMDYGVIDLDRFGKHGLTEALHPRLQWVY